MNKENNLECWIESIIEKLAQNNAIDFDDILVKTLNILRIPKVLEFYQEKYKYIMVDEYQDTNQLQFSIIQSLTSTHNNICVVGDDDQAIYSFRGADISIILNFERNYKFIPFFILISTLRDLLMSQPL